MNRRRDELLEMLLDRGRLRVDELTAHFAVTGMTIRRDLDALEKEGLLIRTHGGCMLRTPKVRELPFREKEQLQREAKETIARAVVSRVPDGVSLYLDTGTTCAMVGHLLRRHRRNLQVFTNNLPAALDLFGAEAIEVMIPGGVLGRSSPDLTGEFGLDRLRNLRFDLAIVGADAFDLSGGIFYAADLPTAALSQTAQRRADQTFVCVDGSKFNKRALAVSGRLRENVTLFTDGEIPAAKRRGLRKLGAEVVIVGRGGTPYEHRKE